MTAPEHSRSPESDPPASFGGGRSQPRLARPEEAEAIRRLVRAAYAHYVPRIGLEPLPMLDDYAARIARRQAWVLADGEIAAVIVLVHGGDHVLVDNVAVRLDRQRRGLGRQLLAFAEERARAAGLAEVRLYTHVMMTENRALYARLGYEEQEQEAVEGRQRVWLRKRL
jgi:GNAT superfamily N-acetyltransferase